MKETSNQDRKGRPPKAIFEGMPVSQKTAISVIEELGGTIEVSKLCQLKPPSVSYWKEAGIPRPWELFLRARFPNLKAWAQLDSTEATTA